MKGIKSDLHIAVETNNLRLIKRILREGGDVNEINAFGDTPLLTTIFHNNIEPAKILLRNAAQTDFKTKLSGSSVFHLVAEFDRSEFVDLLLHYNANSDSRDKYNLTPVHIASHFGHDNTLKKLLHAHANPNVREDLKQQTPLHLAAIRENKNCITILVESGGKINAKNCWGETPIFNTTNPSTIELFLKLGSDISITNKQGKTIVTRSNCNAFNPHLALVLAEHIQSLLAINLNINNQNLEAFYLTIERFESGIFSNTRLIADNHWVTKQLELDDELCKLKNHKVGIRSFKNLLNAHPDIVASATKDENLTRRYFARNLIQEFPNYAWLLEVQYRQGVNRKVLTSVAERKINILLGKTLPLPCTERILRFLENPILRILQRVSEKDLQVN